MKKLSLVWLVVAVLWGFQSEAAIYSVRVDASVNNIPTAFSTAAGSKVIQGVPNVRSILIDNRSSSEIAVNCQSGSTTAPTTQTANIYVAGTTQVAIDNAYLNTTCYIRSMTGGAISSGTVAIMLVGG